MKSKYISFFFIFFIFSVNGQNYNTLIKKKENLIQESKALNKILLETKKNLREN